MIPPLCHPPWESGLVTGGKKSPSPQGANSKGPMEIDGNDLGHMLYGLELDDFDENLPHLTIVRDDHDLVLEGDGMLEDFSPVKKLKKHPPHESSLFQSQKDRKMAVVKYTI